jgi:hypothetical protein
METSPVDTTTPADSLDALREQRVTLTGQLTRARDAYADASSNLRTLRAKIVALDSAIATAEQDEQANASRTLVVFLDGTGRLIRTDLVSRVRGLDADGDVVVFAEMTHPDDSEYLIALTPCCLASGKGSAGSETGVCCRGCYVDVDSKFGTWATVAFGVLS